MISILLKDLRNFSMERDSKMKISVRVKPNSKEEKVDKLLENEYVLRVKAPPKEGKANLAVIELLSEHFGIAKSRIVILKGHKSKNKIVQIL
jgi:hypothetical protein